MNKHNYKSRLASALNSEPFSTYGAAILQASWLATTSSGLGGSGEMSQESWLLPIPAEIWKNDAEMIPCIQKEPL
jgi:hypothetical protein